MASTKTKKKQKAVTAKKSTKSRAARPAAKSTAKKSTGKKTLAFDIGGSGLKASILDENGEMITERVRVDTPKPCPPPALLEKFKELMAQLPPFDRVSVGFPGVVRKGKTLGAVNLGNDAWVGFDLQSAIAQAAGKPTIVINDADMQGLGAIEGDGVELVITRGPGLGSSLFEDGRLAPHIELAHIPFRNDETYEQQLGDRAYNEVGKRRWNKRLARAIEVFRTLTNFDTLYLGGGNAANVDLELTDDIKITSNKMGMKGGIWLWKDADLSDGVQK